jgi:uncharacterized protein with PIN domain
MSSDFQGTQDFFEEIAEKQGWSMKTMLDRACFFINDSGNDENFLEFLRWCQEQEDVEDSHICPECGTEFTEVHDTMSAITGNLYDDNTNMRSFLQCKNCRNWKFND